MAQLEWKTEGNDRNDKGSRVVHLFTRVILSYGFSRLINAHARVLEGQLPTQPEPRVQSR
jgi:hypothetical protein